MALDNQLQLGFQPGDTQYLEVLENAQKRKRGKRMPVVNKIFPRAKKTHAHGPTIFGFAFVCRGVVILYAVRLWTAQSMCAK